MSGVVTGRDSEPAVMVVPGSDLGGGVAGSSGNSSASTSVFTVKKVSKFVRGGYTCCVSGCYNNTKKKKIVMSCLFINVLKIKY